MMATMIDGYVCSGCGRRRALPQGFAGLSIGVDRRRKDSTTMVVVRRVMLANGRSMFIVERVLDIERSAGARLPDIGNLFEHTP